jgi:hypothetical protein
VEIVPLHPGLKVWKAAPLETDTLTGVADYLVSADRAYLAAPLLCVAEAKRDDFLLGQAQCVAEMHACQWNSQQAGRDHDVYGIVSNGQVWQFFKLTPTREVFGSDFYVTASLPPLLGVLDHVCAACARNAA